MVRGDHSLSLSLYPSFSSLLWSAPKCFSLLRIFFPNRTSGPPGVFDMEFPCQKLQKRIRHGNSMSNLSRTDLTWMTWKYLTWSSMSKVSHLNWTALTWNFHVKDVLEAHGKIDMELFVHGVTWKFHVKSETHTFWNTIWHGNSMSNLKWRNSIWHGISMSNTLFPFDMEIPCQTLLRT